MTRWINLQRLWQGRGPHLIAAGTSFLQDKRKKVFLTLDLRQTHFGISLLTEKPNFTPLQANLVQIARKHILPARVTKILKHPSSGDLGVMVETQSEEKPWIWLLRKSRPPELSIIKEYNSCLLRMTAEKTYTKHKLWEHEATDWSSWEDLLPRLLANLEEPQAPTEELGPLPNTDSNQATENQQIGHHNRKRPIRQHSRTPSPFSILTKKTKDPQKIPTETPSKSSPEPRYNEPRTVFDLYERT